MSNSSAETKNTLLQTKFFNKIITKFKKKYSSQKTQKQQQRKRHNEINSLCATNEPNKARRAFETQGAVGKLATSAVVHLSSTRWASFAT